MELTAQTINPWTGHPYPAWVVNDPARYLTAYAIKAGKLPAYWSPQSTYEKALAASRAARAR